MARGFDSKSVEEQQNEAQRQQELATARKRSPQDVARHTEKRSLELQISRIEQQLQTASNDRHRAMLEAALIELRQRLAGV